MGWWTFIRERERSQKSCGDGGSKPGQRDGERKEQVGFYGVRIIDTPRTTNK
jgi:hypothetical protein